MSIFNLKKIVHAVTGFATGGIGGALAGYAAPANPQRTKNAGIQPRVNVRRQTVQPTPISSPIPIAQAAPVAAAPVASLPTASNWSASPFTRTATPVPVGTTSVAIPGSGLVQPAFQQPSFGGGGNSMTWAQGQSPMALYHRFYTKRGTLRRLKANGMPYAAPRMNPMNPRAARRAIRRIRGARKLLQRIERSLPRARSTSRSAPRARGANNLFVREG